MTNVLSLLYGKIYFPTYSNSLKDIGSYLGVEWSEESASGLMSIVWRLRWEETDEDSFKQKILEYNMEDCHALQRVAEEVRKISAHETSEVCEADQVKKTSIYKFGKLDFVSEHFSQINRRAYFDYQRERIFFKDRKKIAQRTREGRRRALRVNKAVEFPMSKRCSACGHKDLYRHDKQSKTVLDLWFYKHGVKRWVVEYVCSRSRCKACGSAFYPPAFKRIRGKYGHNLYSWVVFQMIALRQTYGRVSEHLETVFGYANSYKLCGRAKERMAEEYESTYNRILRKIRSGNLVHADETTV